MRSSLARRVSGVSVRTLLCVLLVLGSVPAAGAPALTDTAATDAIEQSPTVVANYTFALTPDRPGQVAATLQFDLPDTVDEFRATLPDTATVRTVDGFERDQDGTFRWDGTTVAPTLRFDWNVSERTLDSDGAESVDTGAWALLTRPDVDTRWRYTDAAPDYRVEMGVDGDGVADGRIAYLGPHEVERIEAADQTIDIVLPKAVERFDRDALAVLERASGDLRVGARSPSVTAFVVPGSVSFPGYTGVEYQNAFWIRAGERVRTAENLWVHEYVHARQTYEPTTAMEWLDEGAADYYAALVTLRAGAISFEDFHSFVAFSYYADETLTERSSWPTQTVEYSKGRLVVAALDAKLRRASDGDRTFQDVYRRLNDHDGDLTYAAFRRTVVDVGNESFGPWLDEHVDGPAAPEVPDEPTLWSVGSATSDPTSSTATTDDQMSTTDGDTATDDATTTREERTDRTTTSTGVGFAVPGAIVAVALLVWRAAAGPR